MTENSSAGLFMLRPEVSVTVTREEHHQQAFARYPVRGGMSRRVAVELTWCDITSGKYQGERAIEVRLDGYRVGELTYAMSQRYGPVVSEVSEYGRLPGCEAVVFLGKRGTEIQLLLPSTIPVPKAPIAVAPQIAVATQAAKPVKSAKGIFARHKPAWIAGGVVGVILVAAIAGQEKTAPSADSPIARTTTIAPSTTTSSETSTVAPDLPALTQLPAVTQPPAAPPAPPAMTTPTKKTTSAPKPPSSTSKPPKPAPPQAPSGGCDPNYTGCVPIASDVDCMGGSGNGPAYVAGPIQVIGKDIYGLDNDKDGIACE